MHCYCMHTLFNNALILHARLFTSTIYICASFLFIAVHLIACVIEQILKIFLVLIRVP